MKLVKSKKRTRKVELSPAFIRDVVPLLSESALKIYLVLMMICEERRTYIVDISGNDLAKLTHLSAGGGIKTGVKELVGQNLIRSHRYGKSRSQYIMVELAEKRKR